MIDLTEGKVTNAFYMIDERKYKRPLAKQSLDQDEIYIYVYDEQRKCDVGQWVKRSDYISQ